MQVILEILLQFVLEIVAYYSGRLFLLLVAPRIRVEEITRQFGEQRWNWRGIGFRQGNHRYVYIETVQIIGILVLCAVGIAIYFFMNKPV